MANMIMGIDRELSLKNEEDYMQQTAQLQNQEGNRASVDEDARSLQCMSEEGNDSHNGTGSGGLVKDTRFKNQQSSADY